MAVDDAVGFASTTIRESFLGYLLLFTFAVILGFNLILMVIDSIKSIIEYCKGLRNYLRERKLKKEAEMEFETRIKRPEKLKMKDYGWDNRTIKRTLRKTEGPRPQRSLPPVRVANRIMKILPDDYHTAKKEEI